MEKAANDVYREALRRVDDQVRTLQEKLESATQQIAALTVKSLAQIGNAEWLRDEAQCQVTELKAKLALCEDSFHKQYAVADSFMQDAIRADALIAALQAKCEKLQAQIENVNPSQTKPAWTQCTYFKDLPLFGQPVVVGLAADTAGFDCGSRRFRHARLAKEGMDFAWRFHDGSWVGVSRNDVWIPSPWAFQ